MISNFKVINQTSNNNKWLSYLVKSLCRKSRDIRMHSCRQSANTQRSSTNHLRKRRRQFRNATLRSS